MIVENGLLNIDFLTFSFAAKILLLTFLAFYSVFSLILYRQIQLMARVLRIPLDSVLKSVAIIQIGISLALFFIVIGIF
jgi:hypothetical protein